jgi:hypothetical protein
LNDYFNKFGNQVLKEGMKKTITIAEIAATTKGIMPLYMTPIGISLVIPLRAKIFNATGGVILPRSVAISTHTANQIGSAPRAEVIGYTIGTPIRSNAPPSMTKPNINRTIIINPSIARAGKPRSVRNVAAAWDRWHQAINWENITAPIIKMKNMDITFADDRRDSEIFFQVNLNMIRPMIAATKAPMAPPSLGENMPVYIPPTQANARIKTGATLFSETNLGFQLELYPEGPRLGLSRHQIIITTTKHRAMIKPGTKIAIKSVPIDT